jgi:hypothetical protein
MAKATKGLTISVVQWAATHDWYDRNMRVGTNYQGAPRYVVVAKTGEHFDDLKAMRDWAGY